MPQIVMRDPRHSDSVRRSIHGLLAFPNLHDWFRCLSPWSLDLQPLEQLPHIGNHRHASNHPVFCAGFGITPDQDFPFVEITVPPGDIRSLALAEAAERRDRTKSAQPD